MFSAAEKECLLISVLFQVQEARPHPVSLCISTAKFQRRIPTAEQSREELRNHPLFSRTNTPVAPSHRASPCAEGIVSKYKAFWLQYNLHEMTNRVARLFSGMPVLKECGL
jgi:hypothetical protein